MAKLPTIEACILAGGLSSRMGKNKARLRIGGQTFLSRIRAAAISAGLPVRVVRRDLVPRAGPLGGVFTALKTTRADLVLFLSCDMPFVTGSLLGRLQARLTPKRAAVFVEEEDLGFPFLIRRAALSVVEGQLAGGQFSLRALSRVLRASILKVRSRKEALQLTNINTPAEYDAARRLWSSIPPGGLRRFARPQSG